MEEHDGWQKGLAHTFQSIYGFGFSYLAFTEQMPYLELSYSDLSWLRLAAQALRKYDLLSSRSISPYPPWRYYEDPNSPQARKRLRRTKERLGPRQDALVRSSWPVFHDASEEKPNPVPQRLAKRVGDWPPFCSVDSGGLRLGSKSVLIGFALAGLVYGAIHLLAWNAPFPTDAERVLWQASGIVLAISGIIFSLRLVTPEYNTGHSADDTLAEMLYTFIILMLLCYVAARMYLVVECFLSLTYLPDPVFESPNWSQYFPHII